MCEHVDLQIAAILKDFLAARTTNNGCIATVNLFRMPLQSSSRAQEFLADFALKVAKNISDI